MTDAVDFSSHRVMILDDSGLIIELLTGMLKAFHVGQVRGFDSPAMAMDVLQKVDFNALIIDWMMGSDDGVAITKSIRSGQVGVRRDLPIILCTGYTELPRVRQARDGGVNEIIAKPMTPSRVYDKLRQALLRPRPFVDDPSYIGPDRRHKQMPFKGPDRRRGSSPSCASNDDVMEI